MWGKATEAIFGQRWRRDEEAWEAWHALAALQPSRIPQGGEHITMAGRVIRIYQRARRGTKAVVDFGPALGMQDTWWEGMTPPTGRWVVVTTHLWLPPGTHSHQPVFWIDRWGSSGPQNMEKRAYRHVQRLHREQRLSPPAP